MHDTSRQGFAPIAIVVAVLVVLGIAVSAYVLISSRGGGAVSAEARVDQAFHNVLEETSADLKLDADVTGGESGGESEIDLQVRIVVQGMPLPGNEEENPVSQGSADISGTVEGEALSLEAEFRSLPPRTYFRIASLALPDAGDAQALFSAALNKWVYVEAGEEEMIDTEMLKDFSPVSLPKDCQPTPEQKDAVEAYIASLAVSDVVTDIQSVGTVDMPSGDADRSATRFSMSLDEEKAMNIADEVERLSGCDVDESEEENEAEVTRLEVLVGDQTGLLRGLDATVATEDSTIVEISLGLSNFGAQTTVNSPDGAISVEELMNQMMQDMFGGDVFDDVIIPVEDFPTEDTIDEVFEGTDMEYNLP